MSNQTNYRNWRLNRDQDNILWLRLDKENATANTIDRKILEELDHILNDINVPSMPAGIVFASAKESGFIAGADVEQFTKLNSVAEAKDLIVRGQRVLDRIAALPIPTVAMINGFCLGGGFELALACRYRIAEINRKTRIGLPEVLLGIQPGWGGTVRLPALIGSAEALNLILNGMTVDAKKAYRLGMVDEAVPKRYLEKATREYILKKPAPHKPTFLQGLTNNALARPLLAKYMRKQLNQKIKAEHYPAPYSVVDNWEKYGLNISSALQAEADSLSNLVLNDTARNLVRIFFLRERLKGLGKEGGLKVKHVHVIGAGTMGGDIAAWCALQGMRVTLQDREAKFIAPAIKRAHDLYKKKLKEPRLIQGALDNLTPDVNGNGVHQADVIIEAIYENLEAKQKLLKEVESKAKPEAIIASNTSSIPLDEMNTVMKNPERLVGIHFFNPVAKMQLVEVVHGKKTSEKVLKDALSFVHRIERLPLPVISSPGFLVNRVLMPYLMECVVLLEEGVPAPIIDKAATDFGMPMGPVELADTVGLDVCLSVAENLTKYYGGTVPEHLRQMVAEKKLGRKTGEGFYKYKNGKAQKNMPKHYVAHPDIQSRLILRMLNESVACLREKVVADGDLLDAGMIFGTGFAPFRGGPINYICTVGMDKLRQQLVEFAREYGDRFTPDKGWEVEIPKLSVKNPKLESVT